MGLGVAVAGGDGIALAVGCDVTGAIDALLAGSAVGVDGPEVAAVSGLTSRYVPQLTVAPSITIAAIATLFMVNM
jgi:hypothetical protein